VGSDRGVPSLMSFGVNDSILAGLQTYYFIVLLFYVISVSILHGNLARGRCTFFPVLNPLKPKLV
jgi:hypothetical protein